VTHYANTVAADSPTGYWRMGELTGTTAAASAGAVTGTYTNGPFLGVAGAVNDDDMAPKFDGTNDYVGLGDNFDLDANTTYTLECWISPAAAATANYPIVIGKYNATGGWWLYLESSAQATPNAVTFERLGSSGSDATSSDAVAYALPVNAWSHVAVSYDGTDLRIYVNGVQRDTTTSTRSVPNKTTAMTVGGAGGATDSFNGRVDEVAVYPTALSAARIQAHYDAGKP
jgi:hypothetical protein